MKAVRLAYLGFTLLIFALLFASCKDNQSKESNVDQGGYVHGVYASKVLQRDVPYNIYYPLGHDLSDSIPLIYLLHGHGGNKDDWFQKEEGDIQGILDSLINERKIPPVIAVSISAGNSWYVDREERMETFFLSEFVPFMTERYQLKPSARRIIAGNSAGGYGALRFSLQQPELFDEVILLSPASYEPLPPKISSSRKVTAFAVEGVFNDSIWGSFSYKHLLPSFIAQPERPNYYLSVGDDDAYNIVPVVTELQQLFLNNNIKNELRITDGGHDWQCWRTNFSNALVTVFEQEGITR